MKFKKNLLTMLAMMMAMVLMFTACGGNDVDTEVNNSVESNEMVEDTNNGTTDTGKTDVVATPEPTVDPDSIPTEEREVTEFDTYCKFTSFSDSKVTVNTNMTVPSCLNIELIGSVPLYNNIGKYIGYTKENIEAGIYGLDDGWCQLDTKDGSFFAMNEDVKAAMEDGSILDEYYAFVTEKDTSTEDNENNNTDTKKEENLPSYTVEEMAEAIMYINIDEYEVRKGPGTEYDTVLSVICNHAFAVTGKTSNGWYKVADIATLKEGFVKCDYLSVEPIIIKEGGEIPKAPVEESTSSPTEEPTVEQPVATEAPVVTPTEAPKPTEAPVVIPEPTEVPTPVVTPEPTPAPTPQPTPEPAPVVTYTEGDVIGIVESTLQNAGLKKPEQIYSQELIDMFGPTGGMGWAECNMSMTDPQKSANELLSDLQYGGDNMYYIESLGVSNGYVRLKVYYGKSDYN